MIGGGAAIAAFFVWRRSNKQLRAVPSEDSGERRADAPGRLTEPGPAAGAATRRPGRLAQTVATVTWLAPPVKRIS